MKILLTLVVIACLTVLGILILGIGSFSRGDEDRAKRSNRLMWYRIGAQFVAVVLIAGFIWLRGRG